MLKLPYVGLLGLLSLQLAASFAITVAEQPPAAPALERVSTDIGAWNKVTDLTMDPDAQAYLRPDAYIDRNYQAPDSRINLFVAYFKSVKSGYGPHSPAVCLPGAGWIPKNFEIRNTEVETGGSIPVNVYMLEKDRQNMIVMYWYQNGRRTWAEDFRSKLYMLPDLLRYRRSDVALVRVIGAPGKLNEAQTKERMFAFVKKTHPLLAAELAKH